MSRVGFLQNSSSINKAYSKVISGSEPIQWMVLGYVPGSNELEVIATDSSEIEEFSAVFDSSHVMYGLINVVDRMTRLSKILFISWCPESAPLNRTRLFSSHVKEVADRLKGFHLEISARYESDVDPENIRKKIKESKFRTGAHSPANGTITPENVKPSNTPSHLFAAYNNTVAAPVPTKKPQPPIPQKKNSGDFSSVKPVPLRKSEPSTFPVTDEILKAKEEREKRLSRQKEAELTLEKEEMQRRVEEDKKTQEHLSKLNEKKSKFALFDGNSDKEKELTEKIRREVSLKYVAEIDSLKSEIASLKLENLKLKELLDEKEKESTNKILEMQERQRREREYEEQREEALRKELEEKRIRELEEKRQRELEEKRQRELEEKRQRELEEKRQRELEEKRQRELEEKRQRELEEKRQRELEEKRLRELEEKRQRELEEKLQRELEEKRQRELEEKRQKELEEKRQRELEEKRQRELEEKRQRELEEKRQRELEEKRQRELEVKRQRELEEKRKREFEEKRQRELEEKRQRELEEKKRREKEMEIERELERKRLEELHQQEILRNERLQKESHVPHSNTHEAIALYDYDAAESNELSLVEGDRITDIEFIDEGWWYGSCRSKQGLFPANFVQLVEAPNVAPRNPGISVIAVYDYEASEENEISFVEGDIITGVEALNEDWWQGFSPDGHFGMFPANRVQTQS